MDVEVVAAAAIYLMSTYNYYVSVYRKRVVKKKRQKRRWWMHSIHRNRTRQGMENQLCELLKEPESKEFQNFVRMSDSDFEYILQKISPVISRKDTDFRECIPAKIRLAVTFRYLATGDSYRSLHYTFKISSQIISLIIPEVCEALINVLKHTVKIPTSHEEWLNVARGFRFPHCVGALDGKHIKLQCPPKTGSEYYNYKGDFSIVLLGLVDSNYCFLFADIGAQGRINDGDVLRQTVLWQKIINNSINFPPNCPLPGTDIEFPYVILGDGAFALHTNLMTPYPGNHETGTPQINFNQIHSSSRVVLENTFGVMASVFRVFKQPISLDVAKASTVTMTCVLLHNFLRKSRTSRNIYTPAGALDTYVNDELVQPGSWRQRDHSGFFPLQVLPHRTPRNAIEVRSNFSNYFLQNRSMFVY